MSAAFRPGPDRLDPGLQPSGIIIHIYNRAGQLLLVRNLADATTAKADADVAVRLAGGNDMCIVAYDGDSGARLPAEAFDDLAKWWML